jgi:selenide,water dikinase
MKLSPIVKHLVLVGGGHSHLSVLRQFGMKPIPGLALTLISREVVTPYSGSMPAFIAGDYSLDDMHIDLRPLAQFARARLIQAEVKHIDLERRVIKFDDRPDLPFDLLSLNIGSHPKRDLIAGANEHALAVKPIDRFLENWSTIKSAAVAAIQAGKDYTLSIVGGGPASVELAFSMQVAINKAAQATATATAENQGDEGAKEKLRGKLLLRIVTADSHLLNLHNERGRQFALLELTRRGIEVVLNAMVVRIEKGKVILADETTLGADAIIYATGASLPEWPFDCGLQRSEDGFIEVKPSLQTSSHDFVFAAGDAATIQKEPRPKSGVYAVRQGKVLAENLRRYATGRKLKTYFPQKQALALISMGTHEAIATRGEWFLSGKQMWRLKDFIDRRFLEKFSRLPEMPAQLDIASGLIDQKAEQRLRNHAMRCAGCGAKVASSVLEEVLQELPDPSGEDVLTSPGGIEDASQIKLADGRILLQSLDFIKAFTHDPWLFGMIATNHCLSDIFAMGVQPHSALAVAGLPFAEKRYAKQQLKELMLGCSRALQENDCKLIGGHSAEAEQLQFGLSVNGFAAKEAILCKSNIKAGDALILSKPLGTGTLLAADMRYRARHAWIEALYSSMLASNRDASQIFVRHGANACTDITGFGLLGHLLEMLSNAELGLRLDLDAIPAFDGALSTLEQGIISSLHNDNELSAARIENKEAFARHAKYPLLFDPQTAGGLLASVPESQAYNCLQELQAAGLNDAAIIGSVTADTEILLS